MKGENQGLGVKSTEMNEGVGGRTQVHTDRFDTRQVHKPTLRLLAYHDELNGVFPDRHKHLSVSLALSLFVHIPPLVTVRNKGERERRGKREKKGG